ncbi:MAG: hypothetical protein V3W18_11875 [candidate division Zixibacteria bacterium]
MSRVRTLSALSIILVLFYSICASELRSQILPLWGGLEPGSYAVGFDTIEKYDYTRTIRPKRDYFGQTLTGERARPIQICIWYPAEKTEDAKSMILGEYIFPYPNDGDFFEFVSAIQDREIAYLFTILNNDRGAVLDLLSVKVGAIHKAPSSKGSFPLIIHTPDLGRGAAENFILCEYLASHGFIVAATHSVGAFALNAELNAADRETQIDDAGFLLSLMRDYPNVNPERIGALGYRAGGSVSLILGARNSNIDIVASLDGLYLYKQHFEFTRQNPFFNQEKMNLPLLTIYSNDDPALDFSLLDSLVYSHKYSCGISDLTGGELTGYGILPSFNIYSEEKQPSPFNKGYEIACQYLYHFFNGHLNGDEKSKKFIGDPPDKTDRVTYSYTKGETPPPSPEQFMNMLAEKGVETTHEIYNKYKHTGRSFFSEANFNSIGYRMFQGGDIDNAILIFEMNADAYPDSPNSWDSLGEVCEAAGRTEEAIKYLKKVLEILPSDTTTDARFKEQIKNHAQEAIQRLEK